jgi:hypothetical protein
VQPAPNAAPQVAAADTPAQPVATAAPAEKPPEDKRIQIKLPDRIEPGESATLEIELDIGDAVRQLRKQLAERGEVFATDVALAEKIEARVGGSKLTVGPEDRETQAVRPGFPAKWNFFLNPEDVGKQKVNIVLSVELAKGAPPYKLHTETRDLVVERSTWDELMLFVNKNLQWLAASVIVPLVALWWKSRKPAA